MDTCAPSKGLTVTTSEQIQNKKRWDQSRAVLSVLMVNLGQKIVPAGSALQKTRQVPLGLQCHSFVLVLQTCSRAVTELRRGG